MHLKVVMLKFYSFAIVIDCRCGFESVKTADLTPHFGVKGLNAQRHAVDTAGLIHDLIPEKMDVWMAGGVNS